MDDDPEFQRDVLDQKIKAIIREEVNWFRPDLKSVFASEL